MLAWLKPLGIVAGAFGACWIGAIWYWRASNRMPATGDLIVFMLMLPLALLLLVWIGKKIHTRMSAAAAASAAAPVAAAQTEAAPALAAPSLTIVAAAVRAPHGQSTDELYAALAEGSARPALDDQLYDDHGFPVMTARVADNDPAALREELEPWLATRGLDAASFSDEQWRALNAGSAVLAELAGWLGTHPHIAEHTARTDMRSPTTLPLLHLLPVWSAGWPTETRALADEWLRHLLVQAGWPQDRLAPTATQASAHVNGLLNTLLAHAATDPSAPVLAMVIACDSHLSEGAIDAMSGAGRLFTARTAQGEIPGEGAAGLLIADAAQAALLAPGEEAVLLRGAASAELPGSADVAKRVDGSVLRRTTEALLQHTQVAAADVAALTADTDHRTSRVMEVMDLVADQFKELDPAADLASVGAACGSCGAVTYLTALALARHAALEKSAPVLCIGNLDPYRRDVALLAPAAQA
ncbi:hypothetical protein ACFFTM_09790 [Pseudoduganella plicata]|uniref:DUF2875 domain-containing protein n=1 Tax=Pseudoduganella plicata TaxID=321984 RepID=A0A4P7BAV5_9BURK|nr:hypothetical protein [Pseudoduganella plicata]QBQ35153.1 hypothetical protein E1742_02430 [Pseudoduganella plicata]GGZ05469.1 hypothetical protein GCM10007388_43980 [Pseudoduganella plicata]